MKKVIIVGVLFVFGVGSLDLWGMNTTSIGIIALSAFLAGLFIGQRRTRRA